MIIKLSPTRSDNTLTVVKNGDALTINGQVFDFTPLPDGATLPSGAIESDWIVGDVERINGVINLALLLPHGPNPSQEVAFPAPLTVTQDGEVVLPADASEEIVEVSND